MVSRGLKRAALLSILLHLAILFSFRSENWLPETAGASATKVIATLLRPLDNTGYEERSVDASPSPPKRLPSGSRKMTGEDASEMKLPIESPVPLSTVAVDPAVSDGHAGAPIKVAPASSVAVAREERIDLDSVRQYRINLARAARHLKTYPSLARERGWEGVVVVVVTTVAGASVPQVTLSQSSGVETLDQAATALMEYAVQTAGMPEGLHGRQFALTLPIHYRLAD